MRSWTYREWIARGIARALLAGDDRSMPALRSRAVQALGDAPPWLGRFLGRLKSMDAGIWARTDLDALTWRLLRGETLSRAVGAQDPPRIRRLMLASPAMLPPPMGLDVLGLPALPTTGDLADWLGLTVDRLDWLAGEQLDWREDARRARHYVLHASPKSAGGLRLIESPKPELKRAQRRLLAGLLDLVPVHEACHGFVRGRGVRSHAQAHAGQALVLRFDLQDFFPSARAAQVRSIWRTLGFPREVAEVLTRLCTTRACAADLRPLREAGRLDWTAAKRYAARHLPQGAPTSPMLANLCAFDLDLRLDGLAQAFGGQYSRYADDLAFSFPQPLGGRQSAFHAWVAAIAQDEGWSLHPAKNRCMPAGTQQRVTGLVVNEKPQPARVDFDRLKAVLHQCTLHGPDSQNRAQVEDFRAHLLGRMAWIAQGSEARARKLHALFDRIDWPG